MLWAIASSVFVIYLYRKLNAAADAPNAGDAVSDDAIDIELARLNSGIDALAAIGRTRRITP